MLNTVVKHHFTVSQDPKYQLDAGEIRNQVLRDEFGLSHLDFSHDEYDREDNTFYLLNEGQCVGVCRAAARRDTGKLPIEDYIDLGDYFGLHSAQELDSACEFSRLAILPEYRGYSGAGWLVEAVAQHGLQHDLFNVIYCSTIEKLRVFSHIAKSRDLWVELNEQTFCYAQMPHLSFQAALVDMSRRFSGEQYYVAETA